MIASGDYPDLIFTSSEFQRLSDPKISFAWNELIEKYTRDWEVDSTIAGMNTVADGNYYTLRGSYSLEDEWESYDKALPNGAAMALRQDILEALGNPPINRLEDFENVLGMVKKQYPDLIPLVSNSNWLGAYSRMQYGIVGGWNEVDGQLVHSLKLPQTLEQYRLINRLYLNGYMVADN